MAVGGERTRKLGAAVMTEALVEPGPGFFSPALGTPRLATSLRRSYEAFIFPVSRGERCSHGCGGMGIDAPCSSMPP